MVRWELLPKKGYECCVHLVFCQVGNERGRLVQRNLCSKTHPPPSALLILLGNTARQGQTSISLWAPKTHSHWLSPWRLLIASLKISLRPLQSKIKSKRSLFLMKKKKNKWNKVVIQKRGRNLLGTDNYSNIYYLLLCVWWGSLWSRG